MQILRRDKSDSFKMLPLIAIDIENNSSTGDFICASLYGYYTDADNKSQAVHNKDDTPKYFTNQKELCDYIKTLSDTYSGRHSFNLIGYNFGYDHMFLESIIDDSTLFYSGSRFITARIKKDKGKGIQLIDMFNHTMEGTLEDWIKYLDMENKHKIKKLSLDDLENRNKADTKATYYLGKFIQEFYARYDVGLKLTVASGALAIFKKNYFHYYFKRDNDYVNDYERKAYYGGRCECFERGLRKVLSYDINSTYLSIMRDKLMPDPGTFRIRLNPRNWVEDFKKYDGIFHCKVEVPYQKICPLPYHAENKKLIFPYGTFSGYWTKPELENSFKYGVKIIECYDYIFYKKSIPLFKDFANDIWEERREWKKVKNLGMDKMVKRIGNSCYGKFAQKNNDTGYCGKLEDYCGEIPEGKRIIHTTHGGIDYISIPKDSGSYFESDHSFPIIAVYICSYARIKLLDGMKPHEPRVIYCDTDSIKYVNDGINQEDSKDLGCFGFEYEKEEQFFREKMYGLKIKGVKKDGIIYSDIETKETHAKFLKPNKFKESIRRGLTMAKWEEVDKDVDYEHGDKRVWDGETSYPIKIVE